MRAAAVGGVALAVVLSISVLLVTYGPPVAVEQSLLPDNPELVSAVFGTNSPTWSTKGYHTPLWSPAASPVAVPKWSTNGYEHVALVLTPGLAGTTTGGSLSAKKVPDTAAPTSLPTHTPTHSPSATPSVTPSEFPTDAPVVAPTQAPDYVETYKTGEVAVAKRAGTSTWYPVTIEAVLPGGQYTIAWVDTDLRSANDNSKTAADLRKFTAAPTDQPSAAPTGAPSTRPTDAPSGTPTHTPTWVPSVAPTLSPTAAPSADCWTETLNAAVGGYSIMSSQNTGGLNKTKFVETVCKPKCKSLSRCESFVVHSTGAQSNLPRTCSYKSTKTTYKRRVSSKLALTDVYTLGCGVKFGEYANFEAGIAVLENYCSAAYNSVEACKAKCESNPRCNGFQHNAAHPCGGQCLTAKSFSTCGAGSKSNGVNTFRKCGTSSACADKCD